MVQELQLKLLHNEFWTLFSQVIGALIYFTGVAVWLSKDYDKPDAQIGWALIVGIIGKRGSKDNNLTVFRNLYELDCRASFSAYSSSLQ